MVNVFIYHILQEKRKKKTYPNMTPKTLMLSNKKQKSMKGEKLGGRLERQPNRTFCEVGP